VGSLFLLDLLHHRWQLAGGLIEVDLDVRFLAQLLGPFTELL
jgi:hypothetical protein